MMHRAWFDALDHETQADFAEPPPDGPYCVLCDEPGTAAAPLVETRWGPMHAACAASEPRADPDDGPPRGW
jgi:hypothetical protein